MSSLKNATNAHDATQAGECNAPQSQQPVASQPTASSTEPSALCQWRKRWTALWMQETRQAMKQEASDDAD